MYGLADIPLVILAAVAFGITLFACVRGRRLAQDVVCPECGQETPPELMLELDLDGEWTRICPECFAAAAERALRSLEADEYVWRCMRENRAI